MGAIAVLAANRLAHLGKKSAKCFVSYNLSVGDNGLSVCVGTSEVATPRTFRGENFPTLIDDNL